MDVDVPRTLPEVLDRCFELLARGVRDRRSAFHTPALATVADGEARVRTVVLRDVERETRRLVCHTDRRSPKVAQLREGPRAEWLFYDPRRRVQVRALGVVTVSIDDAEARRRFRASREASRSCYRTPVAPGSPLSSSALPSLRDLPSPSTAEAGFENFAVVSTTVDRLDWLQLRAAGHSRARFVWSGSRWEGVWIEP